MTDADVALLRRLARMPDTIGVELKAWALNEALGEIERQVKAIEWLEETAKSTDRTMGLLSGVVDQLNVRIATMDAERHAAETDALT